MTIPNLPTDNLYKFIALTGVFLFIFLFIYPTIRSEKIVNERMIMERDIDILEIKKRILEENIISLKEECNLLEKRMDEKYGNIDSLSKLYPNKFDFNKFVENMKDKEYRDYLKFIFEYEEHLIPEKSKSEEITKTQSEIIEKYNDLRISLVEISSKEKQLNEKIIQEKSWHRIQVYGIIIGIILSAFGFYLWYKKAQLPLDIKLQNEINQKIKSFDDKEKK